jgi:hypothetical protein
VILVGPAVGRQDEEDLNEMNDNWNVLHGPSRRGSAVARIGRPAALVAGGLVAGAVLAGALTAGAASVTGATNATSGYATGESGGSGGSNDTPVTGDELAKVTAAVKAKDSSVTVTSVRKDPDGSYDVFATKSGSQVMYEVSADLKTVKQNTFQGGRPGGAESAPSSSTT